MNVLVLVEQIVSVRTEFGSHAVEFNNCVRVVLGGRLDGAHFFDIQYLSIHVGLNEKDVVLFDVGVVIIALVFVVVGA